MKMGKRRYRREKEMCLWLILVTVIGLCGQADAQDCNITFGTPGGYTVDENSPSTTIVIASTEILPGYGIGVNPGTPDAFLLDSVNPGPSTLFNVNTLTGEVTIGTTIPNFEVHGAAHTVYIKCTTDTTNDGVYGIQVTFSDINDDPVFRNVPATISIPENLATGTTIYTVNYFDEDTGDTVTVTISTQNPTTPAFTNTGQFITVPAGLDYDPDPTYRSFDLTISLFDGTVSVTADLTVNLIDVNDESPLFGAATYTGDIDEGLSAGSAITWVVDPAGDVTDADTGDSKYYSISGTNANHFTCDITSGTIETTRELEADGGSAVTSYSLTMTVEDAGGNTDTALLDITVNYVNDNSPIWNPSSYASTTAENTVAGTSIVAVTVTDADGGPTDGALTVSIESGDDATPKFRTSGTGPYTIETSTTPINYEDAALIAKGYKYTLIVTAVDGGATPITSTATVIVTITPENEFTPAYTAFPGAAVSMSEDEAAGYEIASATDIVATDGDSGADGEITYSITATVPVTNKFHIDSSSGRITTLDTFDYEAGEVGFAVTVRAEDGGATPLSVDQSFNVVIDDYNDHAPEFDKNYYDEVVTEGDPVDTVVTTYALSDDDSAGITSYTTTIVSGNTNNKFKIDNVLDQVQVSAVIDLDVATNDPDQYYLVLEVVDGGTPELTGTSTVHVTVTHSNDHDPVFSATTPTTLSINENDGVGTLVGTVNADDNDYGPSGDITFSIQNGDTYDNFNIDPVTGDIEVKSPVDYETTGSPITLTIKAADGGSPQRTATSDVDIIVVDVNDNDPVCNPMSYVESIGETAAAGTSVAQLACTDGDGDTLTYSITTGDLGDFEIDATGLVKVAAAHTIDYESGLVSYTLACDVTDGVTSVQPVVTVNIDPVNEHVPTFTPATWTVTHGEDTGVGSLIVDASSNVADDDDPPHAITDYSLDSVTPASGTSKFSLDTGTGEVTLVQPLDFEDVPSYVLVITVTDGGGLTDTATITVTVTDVNDNSPTCSDVLFLRDVDEGTFPYTAVSSAELACSDLDAGTTLSYSLTAQSPATEFSVDSVSGDVKLIADTLDFDLSHRLYNLELTVTDGGTPLKSAVIEIQVNVLPVNEGTPTYLAPFTASVPEDSLVGTYVQTCVANDDDSADTSDGVVTYSITNGDPSAHFYIDSSTAVVTVRGQLDAETTNSYDLEIAAVDGPGLTATQTLLVTVTDVNDEVPTCAEYTYSDYLLEDTAIGTVLYSLVCTDGDGDVLTYDITSGDDTTFMVNINGEVILQQAVDFDTGDRTFPLEVNVSDSVNSVIVYVTFIVEAVNEHPPVFQGAPYAPIVPEDTATGTTIETVLATDVDSAATSHGVVKYSFGATCACPEFSIDQDTGDIILLQNLDYEVSTVHVLTVEATDGDFTDTETVTVTVTDVNDEPPVFTQPLYSGSVLEEQAAGESVVTVVANDADTVLNDNNVIRYDITDGDPSGFFAFADPNIGEITTTGPIDYEVDQTFTLTVTAEDLDGAAGANTATTLVTVDINPANEADPVFQSTPYTAPVSEDADLGTTVFQVDATDGDDPGHPHGQVRYSITDGNNAGHFTIDEITGEIITVALLDRETKATYVLTVTATDSPTIPADELSTEENVTITVSDVNDNTPVFTPAAYSASVYEDEIVGTPVVTLTTFDADEGVNGQVDISKTAGDATDDFVLVGNDIQINAPLDHSVKDFYEITYTVTDRGTPSLTSEGYVTITVLSVNSFAPVFNPSTDSVTWSESTNIGQLIYTAVATDADGPGIHSELAYFITDGDPGATFLIDTLTGDITLSAVLDRETIARYDLEITVYDNAGDTLAPDTLSDVMNLTVIVSDENDNNPVFNPDQYFTNIDENVPVGYYVITVVATDTDTGTNGNVQYGFSAGLGQENFDIDPNTGVITTAEVIDYETDTMFSLMVEAVDGGSPSARTGLANVRIDVTDLNDNAPIVSPSNFTVAISEDTASFTLVTPVQVTDADSGANGAVTCVIVPSTNPLGQFAANPTDCDIYTTNVGLDRENIDSYDLVLNATDGGTPMLYGVGYITVIILDVNDNRPVINPASYAVSIAETTAVGTVVVEVLATDADIDENGRLTYELTNGNELDHFHIDPDTGVITVAEVLDRETKASYAMTVTVSDNGTPQRSSTAPVDITLIDVNDNTPEFTLDPYMFTVEENVPIPTYVDSVAATDPDAGTNGEIVYSIESGANKDHFTINMNTGQLYTDAPMDRETIARYELVVKASDKAVPSLFSEADVIIDVADLNDNNPTFTANPYTATIDENTAVGTEVVTVTALDADSGANGLITYSIPASETTANTYFQIGSSTGVITVKALPDYELYPSIEFEVIGADGGVAPRTATTTVIVTITDINDNSPVFNPSFYSEELSYLNDLGEPVVTVTATDSDAGQTVSYYFQEASDLFELDQTTGNIRVIVDRQPLRDTKYDLFVEARDSGSPQRTSNTDATIRIDTFDPYERLVEFYMSVSMDYFLATEDEFIAELSLIIQEDYPTGRAGVSHVLRREVGSGVYLTRRLLQTQDHEITVFVYGVEDNTADTIGGSGRTKNFLTNTYLFNKFTRDSSGTPSDQLVRDPFTQWGISKVYIHEDPNAVPWYQTWWGILLLTLLSLLLLFLILLACYLIWLFCCKKKKKKNVTKKPAAKPDHDERRPKRDGWGSNDVYKHKNPAHPNTNILMLPTSRPETTEKKPPPRKPPPPEKKPNANNSNQNKQFDGRAVDPVTGRPYEYNTQTGQRRWLTLANNNVNVPGNVSS